MADRFYSRGSYSRESSPRPFRYEAEEAVDNVPRPNIEWIPSMKTFQDRVAHLQALYPNRRTTVPYGWPARVDTARAWTGSDFNSDDDFVLHLGPEDIAEIEVALSHFKSKSFTFLCALYTISPTWLTRNHQVLTSAQMTLTPTPSRSRT